MFESSGVLFANAYENQRSGAFHWGIGVNEFASAVVKYAKEKHLPHEHVGHGAHTYFYTYGAKLRESSEWVKIIGRGGTSHCPGRSRGSAPGG